MKPILDDEDEIVPDPSTDDGLQPDAIDGQDPIQKPDPHVPF
jgi:hypothetical protein